MRLAPLLACLALAVPLTAPAAAFECSWPETVGDMDGRYCIKGNAVALDGDTLLLTPPSPDSRAKQPVEPPEEPPPDKKIFGAGDLDPLASSPLTGFIDPLAISPKTIKVRLWGIDAPEMDAPDGSGWAARKTMDSLVHGYPIDCTVFYADRYGRQIATCTHPQNGDIGRALIRWGWAMEYRKYTRPPPAGLEATVEAYRQAEGDAEHNRSGRWKWIFGR